jgi:hypothetical protein
MLHVSYVSLSTLVSVLRGKGSVTENVHGERGGSAHRNRLPPSPCQFAALRQFIGKCNYTFPVLLRICHQHTDCALETRKTHTSVEDISVDLSVPSL